MMMMNKFNCFSNYGFFVICYEEMEEVGKMMMIKTLIVNKFNYSSNYGFFVQTCLLKIMFLRCG